MNHEDGKEGFQQGQLSDQERVQEDVGTIALKPGFFPANQKVRANKTTAPMARVEAHNPAYGELTDAEVMLRCGAGDDAAFNYLVEKYRRPIVSFMYRMAHNQAVAEELAQEVFLRVYRSRGSYQADAKFTTWLYRIATNLAVNHARDTRTERMANTVNLDEPDHETGDVGEKEGNDPRHDRPEGTARDPHIATCLAAGPTRSAGANARDRADRHGPRS